MTYPPQQPGPPGPYEQQPWGGQPQQGPPPNGPQPSPYGYPPQQPPYGYPQQPGQPGPYPQPQTGYDPYGQYGHYPSGGAPGGSPGKKNKTGLIVGIAVAAIVLIGGGITLPLVLTGGNDEEAVKQVAEKATKAGFELDEEAAKSAFCDPTPIDFDNAPYDTDDVDEMEYDIDVGEPTIDGDHATVPVKATISARGKTNTIDDEAPLRKKDGEWCITDESTDSSNDAGA